MGVQQRQMRTLGEISGAVVHGGNAPTDATDAAPAMELSDASFEQTVAHHQETVFLPMIVQGKNVLMHTGGNTWRVDNSLLQSPSQGVAYRRSKQLDDRYNFDRIDKVATWGSIVEGIDTGDGWLQTQ